MDPKANNNISDAFTSLGGSIPADSNTSTNSGTVISNDIDSDVNQPQAQQVDNTIIDNSKTPQRRQSIPAVNESKGIDIKEIIAMDNPLSYTGKIEYDDDTILSFISQSKKLQNEYTKMREEYVQLRQKNMTQDEITQQRIMEEAEEYKKSTSMMSDKLSKYEARIKELAVTQEITKVAQKHNAINPDSITRDRYFDKVRYDFRHDKIKIDGFNSLDELMEQYKKDNPQQFKSTKSGNVGIFTQPGGTNGDTNIPVHERLRTGMLDLMNKR